MQASYGAPKLFDPGWAASIVKSYLVSRKTSILAIFFKAGRSLDKLEEDFESDINIIQLAVIYIMWLGTRLLAA